MMPTTHRLVLPLLLTPFLLGACGAQRLTAAPAAVRPLQATAVARALAAADATSPLEKPCTARVVLNYGNAVAKMLDGKAAFTSLTGTRVGVQGAPLSGGSWVLTYVGTEASGKAPGNPYQTLHKRITITVPPDAKPKVDVQDAEGLPLGMCYYDAPMPEIDSHLAIDKAREMRPSEPTQGGYRLVLQGLMNAQHFQELVWKVGRATQGAERPLTLNATTGEPIIKL